MFPYPTPPPPEGCNVRTESVCAHTWARERMRGHESLIHMWHDSYMCVRGISPPVATRAMTHSYVTCRIHMWRDSHTSDVRHTHLWRDSFHMCDVRYLLIRLAARPSRCITSYDSFIWHTAHLYESCLIHIWHDAYTRVTRLIHVCDIRNLLVRLPTYPSRHITNHDSFIGQVSHSYVTRLIHTCHDWCTCDTSCHVIWLIVCVTWLIHRHDSIKCVPWLIQGCAKKNLLIRLWGGYD